MSYKKKHFGYGKYAPMAVLALTLATQGCKEGNSQSEKNKTEQQGLMDPTPVIVHDKYGSIVKLTLVEIPVYERDGRIKEGYGILTRGQKPKLFERYDIGELNVRKVYLNNSSEPTYIMTGKCGEIADKNGNWIGLVADIHGKVMPVAADNAEQYRLEYEQMLNGSSATKRTFRQDVGNNAVYKTDIDSVKVDSLLHRNDSVNMVDSVKSGDHFSDMLVIDTIANVKSYE